MDMKREALAEIAADIVISYLSTGKKIPASDMRILVGGVCGALNALASPLPRVAPPLSQAPRKAWKPAVAVYKSVRPDALTCLVCGKERLTLRRHLGEVHHLSPEQYRERFNLPDDYPMDAAVYTKVRSDLAKARGLGKRIVPKDRVPTDRNFGLPPSDTAP
jgi:predicted transcriptional regulator